MDRSPLKIILAPDSFKGSLSAREVCSAFAAGVLAVFPQAELTALPMADGGEGTLDVLLLAAGGRKIRVPTVDALGRPITAAIAVLADGKTAVVETAQSAGLTLLKPEERNPMRTSSYGGGVLIRAALAEKPQRLIICLGGSATSEGGLGLAQALGVRFFKIDGAEIEHPITGADLSSIASCDARQIDPRLAACELLIAHDVQNPLLGPQGAVMTFAAQKGATAEGQIELEKGMRHAFSIIEEQVSRQVHELPGSGAAGGMAAGLCTFTSAQLVSGINLVLEAWHFSDIIQGADLILTGEGRLDGQTLSGKVIAGVSRAARQQSIPVIAIAGAHTDDCEALYELGLTAFFSICPGPADLQEAMRHAADWVRTRTEQVLRLWAAALLCKSKKSS